MPAEEEEEEEEDEPCCSSSGSCCDADFSSLNPGVPILLLIVTE